MSDATPLSPDLVRDYGEPVAKRIRALEDLAEECRLQIGQLTTGTPLAGLAPPMTPEVRAVVDGALEYDDGGGDSELFDGIDAYRESLKGEP